ncbi:WD40 repeat domain-containing protein [Tautonia plasticadhaerens]|uniref:Translocation protein TolB n=1 Tax=Tautonia plasticadhaerens TaxID=2527974 RepID=A0A518H0N8_9BACT|nr:WD40 repeat domain-containing protein [Tautonia plasticadhaerens]QDV34410.1 translocation protein TolB [Tautonia plasticadhaerens]
MRSGIARPALALGLIALGLIALTGGSPEEPPTPKLVLQTPPAAGVNSVAVSPDGSIVAGAANEGGVRLYDAKTGVLLRAIGEVGDRSVSFSPDGRSLAAGGFHMDKLVGIYDVQTGRRLRTLTGHTEWETDACTFSPDGTMLASTGTDRQILVWDLATGNLRHRLADQPFRATTLAFSPDGATLACGGDKTVRLWDMRTGQLGRTLTGHRDWVCTVAFSPDGTTLASGSCDWSFHRGHDWPRPAWRGTERCEWRLWDAASGDLKRAEAESGRFLSLAFAPDGTSLACGIGAEVRLYDLASEVPGRVVTSHHHGVTSVAFAPDGDAIISGSHDHTIKRTSLATGREQWHTPGAFEQVNSVVLTEDGALLATGSSDGRFALGVREAGAEGIGPGAVRLWDARKGRLIRRLGAPADQIMAVALAPDGHRVAAGGGSPDGKGVVRVWDVATGEHAWSAGDHAAEVLAVAFAPDGATLAGADADGLIQLRDPRTGTVSRTLSGHTRGATSLAFSADGTALACGAGDGTTHLWEVRSGRRVRSFRPEASQAGAITGDRPMTCVAISRDGSTLATCTAGVNQNFAEPVRLWDVRTGELRRTFSDPAVSGRPMALSPDGAILATGGKTVRLWDARTGEPLRQLYGHLKRTQSLAFSADGRLVVSGGSYGTTNAWEVASGRHLVTLFAFPERRGDTVDEEWLAYHPDGYYDGSPGVGRLLSWRVGDELLPPESLGPHLNRPDRLESALNLRAPGTDLP